MPGSPAPPRRSSITARSVVVGTLLSLMISVGFTYGRIVLSTSDMSSDHITAGAICVFFLVTLLLNPCIKLIRPGWAFDGAELTVIYIMLIIASTIPTWGFASNLVPMLPAVYYFATPENNWDELLFPLVRDWMVPTDAVAIRDFFQGLPAGAPLPWDAWLVPLLAWASFIFAIYLMMIATMVLVRRQWVENERLAFPLVQLPMEMAETGVARKVLAPFFRNPMMWSGFALAFVVMSMKGLHHYYPAVPDPLLYSSIKLFPDMHAINVNLSFTVLGLAYLLSLQVATSFWFFHLVSEVQMTWQYIVGYRLEGEIERFMEGTLLVAHQGMGAMIVLVLFGAWVSRGHIKAIGRKVVRGHGVDDSGEILSYRAAVAILLVCGVFTTVWLWMSGVPLFYSLLFLLLTFAIFFFTTRLVAEAGLGFMSPMMSSQTMLVNFAGTSAVTDAGIFSLALTFSWAGSNRVLLMAAAINAMKLAGAVGALKRPLFWVMVVAIVVTLAGSLGIILWSAYEHGAVNLESWFFTGNARNTHAHVQYKLQNPMGFSETPDIMWPRALWTAVGGTVMAGLIWARHHFLWWPLHPIGFAVCAGNVISRAWFSIFLASTFKAILLRYGGVRYYLAMRPLFLGMILGQVAAAAFWMVVDFIMGGTGNHVPVFAYPY